jgi:chaperonin GroEL
MSNDPKIVTLGTQTREKLIEGVNILADAVKSTLGPKGKNVVIQKTYGSPLVTKDGVTVAKEISLRDNLQNMGTQMVKEVASKTADLAGDGTTTATVLAQSIVKEGMKFVVAGMNSMDLKRGIDKATFAIVEEIDRISKPCSEEKEIAQVASISANSDDEIGKIVAQAVSKVGKDGVVTVESGRGLYNELEIVEGMQFDRGYLSPYFVNNSNKQLAELENPLILICDYKLSKVQDIIPILDEISKEGKSFFVIAEDVEGEVLSTLVINNIRGNIKACAVKAPGFGDRRKHILQDIAILTGGTLISEELGTTLSRITLNDLGKARRISVGKESTTIIGGAGDVKKIKDRIDYIQSSINEVTAEYDKEKLKERAAKLSGGVAIIKVGASTEIEMKEKKDRFDDSINAAKAAIDSGIVAGGGMAFIMSQKILDNLKGKNSDQDAGIKIVSRSIEEPFRQIILNSGEAPEIILSKIKDGNFTFGYDASTGKFGDMFEMGIIDPTKVVKTALQNASSIAGLLLTTECAISFDDEIKKSN